MQKSGNTNSNRTNCTKNRRSNKTSTFWRKSIEIIHTNNLEESVKVAKEKAKEGDIVLLSPASASFDAFKNFEERGNYFKTLVNNL